MESLLNRNDEEERHINKFDLLNCEIEDILVMDSLYQIVIDCHRISCYQNLLSCELSQVFFNFYAGLPA